MFIIIKWTFYLSFENSLTAKERNHSAVAFNVAIHNFLDDVKVGLAALA